jgi:hypothetical protein
MSGFTTPAIIEGISPLKDGGMSIRLHTNEMDDAEKSEVIKHYQKFGWMAFSEQEDSLEIPDEVIRRDTGGKTPSQRLRAVLHVLYQQSGRIDITFEQYYSLQMEKFINRVKEELKD